MKSISPFKILTAVGFLIVSLNAGAASAPDCESVIDGTTIDSSSDCKDLFSKETPEHKEFKRKCSLAVTCFKNIEKKAEKEEKAKKEEKDKEREDKKDKDNKEEKREANCTSALEKFDKADAEATGACDSFEQTDSGKNSCQARVNACNDQIRSATGIGRANPDEAQTEEQKKQGQIDFYKLLSGAIQQTQNTSTAKPNPSSCVNFLTPDRKKEKRTEKKDFEKEKKNEVKDHNKEIQQFKEKIAEEKKKINEENAKLREKQSEIKSDQQKVDEAVKKAIRSVDEKKGERIRKSNEDLAKSAIAIRKMNEEIIKLKETSETIKFDYAQKMVQFDSEKVNTQCQTAIDTAKQCLIKSSKGVVADPKGPCAGLEFSGKGSKGTAQLKAKIAKIRDACFEQANLAVSKAKFEQNKSLRTIQTSIDGKLVDIADANKDIERKQNDSTSINAESDKERTDEENNAKKLSDNLREKLADLGESTREAVEHSKEKIAEFNRELADLKIKITLVEARVMEPDEYDSSLTDADGAIGEMESKRKQASKVCCPKKDAADPKAADDPEGICKKLKDADINKDDGGGRSKVKEDSTK